MFMAMATPIAMLTLTPMRNESASKSGRKTRMMFTLVYVCMRNCVCMYLHMVVSVHVHSCIRRSTPTAMESATGTSAAASSWKCREHTHNGRHGFVLG